MFSGISYSELLAIADAIGCHHKFIELGLALFGDGNFAKIKGFRSMNYQFGAVGSDGTRAMLEEWKAGVGPAEQRATLREALMSVKLVEIAETHLQNAQIK